MSAGVTGQDKGSTSSRVATAFSRRVLLTEGTRMNRPLIAEEAVCRFWFFVLAVGAAVVVVAG